MASADRMVRPFAELLPGYNGRTLTSHDPVLTLVHWAAEPADPLVYAPQITAHVLMLQGIVDHYILPRIANALSIPLGLTLAGPELDAEVPGQQQLSDLLRIAGRAPATLPTSASVVMQHPEDGSEVVFQTEAPKAGCRCFLASIARGSVQVAASCRQ